MPECHTPANRSIPSALARGTLLPALLVIVAVAVGCALVSPPIGTWREILANPGLYIDLLALLFLVFMLWSSAKVRMSHIAVNWVRYGLLLWIAGGTFDVMDEIVVQPRWMGYYCEDLLRLSGMLLTVVGVYKIIERINLLYYKGFPGVSTPVFMVSVCSSVKIKGRDCGTINGHDESSSIRTLMKDAREVLVR